MESKIYNQSGKEVGTIGLPEAVFGASWNADLIHQVVTSTMSSRRKTVAHAKDRGEVSGGGRKPWKQKGTGRARHGSTRSPIWVGGGVAHGPITEKNFDRKVNREDERPPLCVVLSKKFKTARFFFVDSLALKDAKTKEAKEIVLSLSAPFLDMKVLRQSDQTQSISRLRPRTFRSNAVSRILEISK
jgi:large subunit ribosomal protein L4